MLRLLPVLCLTLAACQPADLDPRVDVERGAALFQQNCAACHGADATGGVGPDLTRLTARNGGTYPATRVMAQIDGLARHGDDGALMPEFGAGDMGPTVVVEHEGLGTPVPADLLALSEFLASVQS